mgnify:CR=1 FL=1
MKRRGFALVIALAVLTVVGAATTLLTLRATFMLRQRNDDRTRSLARVALDSGVAFAASGNGRAALARSDGEITLPIDGILVGNARGTLRIARLPDARIQVAVTVESGPSHATEEATLESGQAHGHDARLTPTPGAKEQDTHRTPAAVPTGP